jgi:small acid-soluble spore protein F (minor alpha/beta-type SASP)
MGRRKRGTMSESFKEELAKELGFYEVIDREGWQGIRAQDAGNMVKRAIEIAQAHLVQSQSSVSQVSPSNTSRNLTDNNEI